MVQPSYLRSLCLGTALWASLLLAFAWTIDPYGVSPLQVVLPGVNALKPKRIDIDRLIKPHDVWRLQPRTVFLGTSRTHQSIDPAGLDGTRFAPAYNASIPAGTLRVNVAYLEQYLELDPRLRTVVVELFLYNFLGQAQSYTPRTREEFIRNQVTLLVSMNALWDAMLTWAHNGLDGRPTDETSARGHLSSAQRYSSKVAFDAFATGIWPVHAKSPGGLKLHEPAFQTVRELTALTRAHDVELIWIATPNHAYLDYYLDAIGAWDLVEDWLTRVTSQGTVLSFSQPNAWVYEPVREGMEYWNDPWHFSLAMGRAMQASLAGTNAAKLPDNFMVRLTPDRVPAHIEARRQAIRRWARENRASVERFDEERRRRLGGP